MREFFSRATPKQIVSGSKWYNHYHQWCRDRGSELGFRPQTVAGVVSALSPNNKWERNLQDAVAVLKAVRDDISPDNIKVCTYNSNQEKAFKIAQNDDPFFDRTTSPKTHAFVSNLGELDASRVTLDIWMWRVVNHRTRKPLKSLTEARYRAIEQIVLDLASGQGVTGYEYQAIVWEAVRESLSITQNQ